MNYPNVRPEWLDTDTFIYQEQITLPKYAKELDNGKENTAMGFLRFVTSDEWTQYIKYPFNFGGREQYL